MFRQTVCRFLIIALCSTSLSSYAPSADPPRTADLIKQLVAALEQDRNPEDLEIPRFHLAEALALTGDSQAARRQADLCTGDLKALANLVVWEIELARGLNPRLPVNPAEKPEGALSATILASGYARALERAGRSHDADALLSALDESIASKYARIEALLTMAEDHLAAGHRPQARQRLDQAITQFAKYRKNALRTEWFERAIRMALALEDKALSTSLRDQFSSQLESRSRDRSVGQTVPADWSALGLWSFQIGAPEKVEAAFARALKDLQSSALEQDSVWHDLSTRLDALALIASRQFQAGRKREATNATSQILEECQQIQENLRGFRLRLISGRLAEGGDIDDALRVVARNPSAYFRALSLLDLARQAIKKNDLPLAMERLRSAREHFDQIDKADERWHALSEIAEVSAATGDRERASQCFSEAAAIVARQSNQSAYQNIARGMVRAGFFGEAHEMLGRLPESRDRILPLAELTLATARREFPRRP